MRLPGVGMGFDTTVSEIRPPQARDAPPMVLPAELFPEPISFKQIVFVVMTIGFLAAAIPATFRFRWMEKVCIAGILFMTINPVDVTFFSYTNYRGDIRGIEFGVTDWLVITLIVTMQYAPRWRNRRRYYRQPNEVPMALYLGWCILSIGTATIPQFAFFGVTRILRAYALFWVAYNWLRDEDDLRFVVWCVVGLTFYSFWQVLMDKYMRGVFPPRGSFDHQNSLVTFQNILNFIIFAVLLGDTDKVFDRRTLIYWGALGAGALTSVATLSRGGMATMVLGFMLITPVMLWLKQPPRKRGKKFGAIGVMGLAALPALAVVLPQIVKRFETAPEASAHARDLFNEVAQEMGQNHFFGVGLNNYSLGSGYIPKFRDLLPPIDHGGLAHHIYWLHYAELGIVGVSLWVLMMTSFILILLRFVLRRRDGPERVFAVGVLTAFCIAMLIGTLEWNWRQTQLMLTYMMFGGFACALPRLEKARAREHRRRRELAAWLLARQQQTAVKSFGAREPPETDSGVAAGRR